MLSQARLTATFRRGVLLRAAKLAVSRASSAALLPAHVTRGAVADGGIQLFSSEGYCISRFASSVRSLAGADSWFKMFKT